jgi:spermidine synthase
VQLERDAHRRRAWTVLVDGTPQSHVDLDDPTWLEFEYMRRLALVTDLVAPPGRPVDAVHLGGAGMTLARYIACTRPRSRQRVFETDTALTALVHRELPLQRGSRVRVSGRDAREGLHRMHRAAADLLVTDVFAGAQTPAHLTSVQFLAEVARVLRPGGLYAANVADGAPLGFTRGQVATAGTAFAHVCLLAEPAVLRGRRFGNLVLVASHAPLPVAELTRRAARDPVPARVLADADLRSWAGAAAPVDDSCALPSPAPPAGLFDR